MTKTDLPYNTAGDLNSAGDPSPAIDDIKNYMGDVWSGVVDPWSGFVFVITFSKIISRT